jgi:hypothetical protein
MRQFLLGLFMIAGIGTTLPTATAQGALLPAGRNAVFAAAALAGSLESDGTAAIGPVLGYTYNGQVDFSLSGGWLAGSQAYKGSFFGGGVEVHVLKEFPAPLGVSLQGIYQGNFFGDDPDNFFYTGHDYGTYFLGINLYKTMRGAVDRRPTILFLSPGITGINSTLLPDAGANPSLRLGLLFNAYSPQRIFSLGLAYQRIFDAVYGGGVLDITALYSFSKMLSAREI